MARSVCKGRLVDRSDAGGTECTMVSSEPLCIQGLQGWTPCQFCIPRWCQNQYLDGQWYGEVWHLPGHSQLWIHHEVPQDDHLLLSAWKSDSRAGHYDSKMLIEDGDRSIHPRGSKHTSCGLCKATPWPVELLTKSCHFLWIVRLLCWSFAMTPFSFHLPGTVKVLSFDAHFGVHRHVHKDFRPSRTVALRGRPKKKQHHKGQITYLHMRQGKASWRTGCLDGNSSSIGLPGRLWQEWNTSSTNLPRKRSRWLHKNTKIAKVKPHLLVHDDACDFEKPFKKSKR